MCIHNQKERFLYVTKFTNDIEVNMQRYCAIVKPVAIEPDIENVNISTYQIHSQGQIRSEVLSAL